MTHGNKYPLPPLTMEQRREALKKAVALKSERAVYMKKIKSGEIPLYRALLASCMQRVKAKSLIVSLPGVGEKIADRAMAELGIAPSRRVAGLGVRQREKLIERFGGEDE